MCQLAARRNFVAQRPFRPKRQMVLRRLAINQKPRTAWLRRGNLRPCAVPLFAHHKQQSKLSHPRCEQFLRRCNHRCDDPLRVASAPPKNIFLVFGRTEIGRNCVHVRRQRHHRLAPRRKKIVAVLLCRHAAHAPVASRRQRRQMRKQVVAHVFLVVRRGLDIHQRACQFEQLHSGLFCPSFWGEGSETKGRNREAKIARGCRLSIALHPCGPNGRNQITDDSGQALDLPPNPALLAFAAVSADNLLKLPPAFIGRKEPLSLGRPKRTRNSAPGYSWPPHLYQEKSSLEHCRRKCQQKLQTSLEPRIQSPVFVGAQPLCGRQAPLCPFCVGNDSLRENYSSSGFSGTLCEATRSSPLNAASAGRRPSASCAQISAVNGLLFSSERCASTRYRAAASKPSGSDKYSLTA